MFHVQDALHTLYYLMRELVLGLSIGILCCHVGLGCSVTFGLTETFWFLTELTESLTVSTFANLNLTVKQKKPRTRLRLGFFSGSVCGFGSVMHSCGVVESTLPIFYCLMLGTIQIP